MTAKKNIKDAFPGYGHDLHWHTSFHQWIGRIHHQKSWQNKYHCTISGGFSFHLKKTPMQRTYHHLCFCVFFFVSYRSSCIYMEVHKFYGFDPRILLSWVDHPSGKPSLRSRDTNPYDLHHWPRAPNHEDEWITVKKRRVIKKGMCFFHSVKQVVLMIGWGRLMMFIP